MPFSCKTRGFCPSCDAMRSVIFAERLSEEILESVPHAHYTLAIPKLLRTYFKSVLSKNAGFLTYQSREARWHQVTMGLADEAI